LRVFALGRALAAARNFRVFFFDIFSPPVTQVVNNSGTLPASGEK
jgi:hypothetical protein